MCISDIYIIPCQSTASICTNNIIQSSEISKKSLGSSCWIIILTSNFTPNRNSYVKIALAISCHWFNFESVLDKLWVGSSILSMTEQGNRMWTFCLCVKCEESGLLSNSFHSVHYWVQKSFLYGVLCTDSKVTYDWFVFPSKDSSDCGSVVPSHIKTVQISKLVWNKNALLFCP